MNLMMVVGLVGLMGALGGLANCVISGELSLPQYDKETNAWKPGWVGNVLVGALAALVIWGIYGPWASHDILSSEVPKERFTLGQLLTSPLVGMSGGSLLTTLAREQAARFTKQKLANSIRELAASKRKGG